MISQIGHVGFLSSQMEAYLLSF